MTTMMSMVTSRLVGLLLVEKNKESNRFEFGNVMTSK